MKKYKCPCCGYYTLDDGPGRFDICQVCYWEDDGIQADDPEYWGGANHITLNEAQANYKKIGAIEPCFLKRVRPPLDDELIGSAVEEVSVEEKKEFAQWHKANLLRQYFNIQKLLQRDDLTEETMQNLKRNAALVINALSANGIVFDKATGKAIDSLTGLIISSDSDA
jgi:hypothetical protein